MNKLRNYRKCNALKQIPSIIYAVKNIFSPVDNKSQTQFHIKTPQNFSVFELRYKAYYFLRRCRPYI